MSLSHLAAQEEDEDRTDRDRSAPPNPTPPQPERPYAVHGGRSCKAGRGGGGGGGIRGVATSSRSIVTREARILKGLLAQMLVSRRCQLRCREGKMQRTINLPASATSTSNELRVQIFVCRAPPRARQNRRTLCTYRVGAYTAVSKPFGG